MAFRELGMTVVSGPERHRGRSLQNIAIMANRDNHYEAAFEEYLRSRQVPYVAVDEARRRLRSDGQSINNLDFIR